MISTDHARFTPAFWRLHAQVEHLGIMKTALLVVLLAATPAFAQPTIEVVPTCVIADDAQRMLLVRALERLDLLIVETGCQDTITLTEEVDGDKIILRLSNGTSKRKLTIGANDDRSVNYTRMAKSLLEPEPAPAPAPAPAVAPIEEYPSETPAITTPTSQQLQVDDEYTEVEGMHSAWYMMLGLGTGKGLTVGYRVGERTKFDLSGQVHASDGDSSTTSTVAVRAQLLRVVDPKAVRTLYYGGGLGFASSEVSMDTNRSKGSGLRLEGTVGAEFMRSKSATFFLEGGVAVPLYDAGDVYPATFLISVGAGL